MRGLWAMGAVACGCSFSGPSAVPDATVCAEQTLAFGTLCAGPELAPLSIGEDRRIDTTTGMITDSAGAPVTASCVDATLGGREVCAIWLASLEVDAEVRLFGDRPLVIISTGELRVRDGAALLAGSGDFGGLVADGPGANPDDCDASGRGTDGGSFTDNKATHGGGGGGGFASRGGDGGTGRSGNAPNGVGGQMVAEPTALRGGCPGGEGGTAAESGAGGSGGGALYLASLTSRVRIDGAVDAGGEGGEGGRFIAGSIEGGGGGGGSGGMIAIEGELVLGGTISVAGGGGGEGGEADNGGEVGAGGEDARLDGAPASGGSGNQGPNGGDGATGQVEAGSGDSSDDGGAGGGGGVGYIAEL